MKYSQNRIRFLGVAGTLAFAILPISPVWAGLGASVTLKQNEPTSIKPGEITTLEITLSNNNSVAPINAVNFSNSLPGMLPNGLKIAGAATYTCFNPTSNSTVPGSGTFTSVIGSQAIQLSGGMIPARDTGSGKDGTCTLLIPVTAGSSSGSGTAYTYTIASAEVTGTDGASVSNLGSVSQSINVTSMSKPTITKTFSNSTAILGGAKVTLTLKLSNSNSVAIPNFSITDTFPTLGSGGAIIKVANPPNATLNCNNGGAAPTFTPTAGADTISASGTIPAKSGNTNGLCTLTVDVIGEHTNNAYTTGAKTNTISATADFSNSIGIAAQSNATANITVTSPLDVTKGFSPASLADGQAGLMTITLKNNGTSDLTVTSFNDSPIDGTGSPTAGKGLVINSVATTCPNGIASIITEGSDNRGVKLTGGIIQAGGSCAVTANFTATTQTSNTPVTYTNTLAEGAVGVTTPGIVSQSRSATILVADTLRVLKTNKSNNPRPGNPVQYEITVQNWSAADMNYVKIVDALQNGMTFLNGTIYGIDFTPSLSGINCSGLTVSNNTGDANADFVVATVPQRTDDSTPGECVVTFFAMTDVSAANNSSTVNNIASGDVCTNSGSGVCNGGSAASGNSTVSLSPMTISKSFNPGGPLNEGIPTRMTISLSNYSANPLTNVSISDTLPIAGSAQMKVASPANAYTSCGAGNITATSGATSVAMNGGTVPARANKGSGSAGTCVLQIDMVGIAGNFTNTATAAATETYANGNAHLLGPITGSAGITYSSILSAVKSFSPGVVSSGGRSTVIVRMTNADTVSALTNVKVIDPLPTGMKLASPTRAYTTCDGRTSIAGNAGDSSITLNGATIAASGSCDFIFDVIATGTSSWVNSIPAGNILAQNNGATNQSPVVGTLNFTAGNNLVVAKATSPSSLTFPGQASRLTITINNGATAVTGVTLTDYFTLDGMPNSAANGMTIAANPQPSTTCPGGTVTALAGGASVTLLGGSLASNASCTVSLNVTSTKIGGLTNYIPPGAIITNQGLSNALQATTSLTTQTNLGVTKQFTPNVIKPNSRARLRITFYNAGALQATNLSVLDTLPAGLTVPVGPSPATTCGGATLSTPSPEIIQVSGGSLAGAVGGVASSCYAEIDVVAGAEGVYVNTIPVAGFTATVDGVPTSNTDPATDTLRVKQPIKVHKAIGGLTLDAGNPGGFNTGDASRSPGAPAPLVIRLENPNSDALTKAALEDTLPEGLVLATSPSAVTTCAGGTVTAAVSGKSVSLSGATIPAAGFCTLTVNVLSNIAGAYTNTIPSGSVKTFEGVSNEDPSSARILITSVPGISKQFSPPVIVPNTTSTLTIIIDNDNQQVISLNSDLTDTLPTLPSQVQVASPPNLSTTCRNNADNANASIVNSNNAILTAGDIAVRLRSGNKVPVGGCRINVDITAAAPGSYINVIPTGALSTNVGENEQPANAPLMLSTLGWISGKVFLDYTSPLDGMYLSGTDKPINGVEIQLRDGLDCGGNLLFTTHTDTQGNYLFAELAAGTYSVCETEQPVGTLNSLNQAGTIVGLGASTGTVGTESNPDATSSQIIGIVLGDDAGDTGRVSGSPNNNFSEVLPVSIVGKVFMDMNNDGIPQGVDPALPDIEINLSGIDWLGHPINRTFLTDQLGQYSFEDLPPPDDSGYTVTETTQPPASRNGITTAGGAVINGIAGIASGTDTLPSVIATIKLPPGTTSMGNNFAETPINRSIYGWVYRDYDDNGNFDGADVGITGQSIELTGNDVHGNPVSMTTTTQTDGSFRFIDLPESDGTGYTLSQPSQPADTLSGFTTPGTTGGTATSKSSLPSVISGINLQGANTVSVDNLFGEIYVPPPTVANLSGTVYHDRNNDGAVNLGEEGIPGVLITLWNNSSQVANATTDSNGAYSFINLQPGNYRITEIPPVNWLDGKETIGSSGGSQNENDAFDNVQLVAGANAGNYNFGELLPAAIAGVVYVDPNNNATLDVGESIRIPEVSITLSGVDDLGNGVQQVLVSSKNGAYLFANLRPGSYMVTETNPAWLAITGAQPGLPVNGIPVSNTLTQVISVIQVASGNALVDYNFGHLGARVEGTVYFDNDANGQFQTGIDILLAGVTVNITDANGVIHPVTTDEQGFFIKIVPPGNTIVDVQSNTMAIVQNPKLTNNLYNEGSNPNTLNIALGDVGEDNTGYLGNLQLQSLLQVSKTVYEGHDNGASCPGVKELVVVDKNQTPKPITWCFSATNTGSVALTNPIFKDDRLFLTSPGIDQQPIQIHASSVLPLAPGATAYWYVEEMRDTSLVNVVNLQMTPTDNPYSLPVQGADNSGTVFAYVFDPPFGIKTGTMNGVNIVRWTMVWINDSPITANNVYISDSPPEGMTYRTGSIQCQPQGLTTVLSCQFEPPGANFPRGRIMVMTNIGPDLGATNADNAINELAVSFDVTVPITGVEKTYENQGTVEWNPIQNGSNPTLVGVTNDPNQAGAPSAATPVTVMPSKKIVNGIPTLSEWAMLVLSLLLMLAAYYRLSRMK